MGFWSTLVHTAAQVTHWVSNNAGSIASAASTIAQIAGVADDENAAEDDNPLVTMINNVDKAEGQLNSIATTVFPQPVVPSGYSLQVVDMPALWPTPGTSKGDANIPPEISTDITRLLAINGIPVTNGKSEGNDQQIDIGQTIANQLFVPPNDKCKVGDNIYYNSASFLEKVPSPTISGGMVYYQIPLGNPGTHAAWHSHIRLYYLHSVPSDKVLQDERRALSIKPFPSKIPADQAYSSATLSVQWEGARGVADVMSRAGKDLLTQPHSEISISLPVITDGTRFKYQFQIPTKMGPAEVAGALAASLGKVLPDPSPDHPLPRMPAIRVANLQTFIPESVTSA
jgi:hypothetical protein